MLKKSLFRKLLSINLLIIGISFALISLLLFQLLGDYVVSEKEEALKYTGEKVCELTRMLIENNNSFANRLYRLNLESYGDSLQALIIVTDRDGTIFAISNSYYSYMEGKKLDKEQYAEVILGKQIKHIGNFNGLFEKTVLTIGIPLEYNDKIIGAVFLHTPTPEINKMRIEVYKLFVISMIVAGIVSFVLIYFFSRKISYPLKMISKTAKSLANGQFEKRVDIEAEDEIGELTKAFNSMAQSLEELEDMRKTFIANVSHELRTPMTTITGFIDGIIDGTIPKENHKKYLGLVLDEARRMSRLVNDLLILAKMESGENTFHPTEFDITEIIRKIIIRFENRITDKNLHVNALFEEENIYVLADKDSIQQVILNLLDNAIKFSEPNTDIDITVKSEAEKVYISIKDYGITISEEEVRHIWNRFYKTDKSRSKDKTGTGLGLSIVKNIINQHEEEIWVDSVQGQYTQFSFTLKKA